MSPMKCPICGRSRDEFESPASYLPFCSLRCRQTDMGKWFGGFYSVSRPLEGRDEIDLIEPDEEEHGAADPQYRN
ncbi:MAG: DNA gyrase inhibitor YacG [Candidatus Omnitrophica bacterium]|nr:DNA gyrase inhibitor YacG [Candidatus Omnitrophota bacterium]